MCCVIGLVLTYSRAPLILGVASIAGMSIQEIRKRSVNIVFVITVLLGLVVLSIFIFIHSQTIDMDYLLRDDIHNSDTNRLISAKTALKLIEQKPLLGYSPGEIYIRGYEKDEAKHINLFYGFTLKTPHCLFLLLAVENGLFFVILWIGVVVTLLASLWIPNKTALATVNGHWFVLAVGVIYSLVTDGLAMQYRAALLFWLIVGVGLARSIVLNLGRGKKQARLLGRNN
jgi:O-antigen ligase